MTTERLMKWSKESQEFFNKAEDNSIVLDLVISFNCESQTGEGFEELVNTINTENIKRKVKKVVITDTSYLYRHVISQFSGYCDPNIPTEWYLKNKEAIKKLKVDTELKSWVSGLKGDGFKDWSRRIKQDFFTDSDFKNAVIQLAMEFTTKNFYDTDIGRTIDFILEETAYTAMNLKDANIVYPTGVSEPVNISIKKYNLGTKYLSYKVSNHAQHHSVRILDRGIVDREVIKFIKERVTNVNFYVVDRGGNIIYMNQPLVEIVSEKNAKDVSTITWQNSLKVMEKKETLTFEEHDKHKIFLSVKSPLVINNKIEGVIGLAVDITDRKKREELEKEAEVKDKLYKIAKEVAHDICSPLAALECVKYTSLDKLGEKERKMFELSTRRLKEITKKLIDEYRKNRGEKEVKKEKEEDYIMPSSMKELIESMRYRYQGRGIEFKFNEDQREKFAFIKGEYSDFSRMMTNVIKNGVEAVEVELGERVCVGGGVGVIEVGYEVKGEEVEIRVKDNGKGMPKDMAEKLKRGEEVGTTKEDGHGIGTQQIMGTIKEMKGKIEIESREGEGTEFILRFQKCERPRWFEDKIEIKKGETVVILEDDLLVHEVWREKLRGYEKEIEVKYFTQGLEALKYLNSLENKEKAFLIADYELRKQGITGIEVIEKGGMKERHIMVTNAYLSDIKDFEEKSKYIKIFSKMYINDISIVYKT